MKVIRQQSLFILCMVMLCSACKKEANRKLLNAYFKYEVDGKVTKISDGIIFSDNLFECNIIGDTTLQIIVSRAYEGASIFITDDSGVKDGMYVLSDANTAYFVNPADAKKYYTTATYRGSVTIAKTTFQAKDLLQTLTGSFDFRAVDTVTGKNFSVTNGSFLMERKQK